MSASAYYELGQLFEMLNEHDDKEEIAEMIHKKIQENPEEARDWIRSSLETADDEDKELHQMLRGVKKLETEEKKELEKDQELENVINKALKAVDDLEEAEAELHEVVAKTMNDEIDPQSPANDYRTYKRIADDIDEFHSAIKKAHSRLSERIKELEQEGRDIKNLRDILRHLEEQEERAREAKSRANNFHRSH